MKTLKFNNEEFKAEKIFKTDIDIIGQDANGNELFAFRGISDFTGFDLGVEQEFDKVEPTKEETLRAKIIKDGVTMQLKLAKQDQINANLLAQNASLSAQILKLIGGTK